MVAVADFEIRLSKRAIPSTTAGLGSLQSALS